MGDVKHMTPRPSGMVRNAVSKMLEKGRHNIVTSSIQSVDSEDHEGQGGVSLLDNDSDDDYPAQPIQSTREAVVTHDTSMDATPKASVEHKKHGNAPGPNFTREFRRRDKKVCLKERNLGFPRPDWVSLTTITKASWYVRSAWK